MLGVAGMWNQEQITGWRKVTDTIHSKGGVAFCQRTFTKALRSRLDLLTPLSTVWHQGRNAHSTVSGLQPVSSSAVPITDSPHQWAGIPTEPFEVPRALSIEDIASTQEDFVKSAITATTTAGFDGVEIHAGMSTTSKEEWSVKPC